MKKTIALILALILSLFLCSCGNNGASKEAMINAAKPFDITEFHNMNEENPLRAEETYVGNTYSFHGFVGEITNDSCILGFYNDANQATNNTETIRVPLDKETLRNLNIGEQIQIVGNIKDIRSRAIVLNNAYYIDNISVHQARVLSLIYASASDATPAYCVALLSEPTDGYNTQYCLIYFNGDEIKNVKENDKITVTGTLSLVSTNPIEGGCYKYENQYVGLKINGATLTSQ